MKDQFKSLSDAAMLADLQRLAARSADGGAEPAILVQSLPPAVGPAYRPQGETAEVLTARSFTGRIARDWRMVSFSGLAAGRREETPDYDAAPDAASDRAEPAAEPQGIFAFPRGTKAGTSLHKIFEVLDFQERDDEALRLLVREKLSEHGFPPDDFSDTICAMVRRTLAVSLAAGRPGFTLANVPTSERLNELEFQFPIERLTPDLLQAGFAGAGSPPEFLAQLARLDFQAVGGFVKGFIDLVFRFDERFYIVDWKSNWLGPRVEDYGPPALEHAMAEQFYTLQYHLYTVALHRYLKLRLRGYDYEQHFGGVRYLFLRGLDPARPELGVFSDRPAAAWVAELSARLAGGRREAIA